MKKNTINQAVLDAYFLAVEYLFHHGNNEKAHSSRAFAMLAKMNRAKEYLEKDGEVIYALELANEVREEISETEKSEHWFKEYYKQNITA